MSRLISERVEGRTISERVSDAQLRLAERDHRHRVAEINRAIADALLVRLHYECKFCDVTVEEYKAKKKVGDPPFVYCMNCPEGETSYHVCGDEECRVDAIRNHKRKRGIYHEFAPLPLETDEESLRVVFSEKIALGLVTAECTAAAIRKELADEVRRWSGMALTTVIGVGKFIKKFDRAIAKTQLFKGVEVGGYAAAAGLFVDCAMAAMQLYDDGDRTLFFRTIGRSVAKNSAAWGGAAAGGLAGAKAGVAMSAWTGPCIAASCGVIGAIIGAITASVVAGKAYDYVIPESDKKKTRKECAREALSYFGFTKADVKNKLVFNSATVSRKFKEMARTHHPDQAKYGGCNERYILLTVYYGILQGILKEGLESFAAEVAAAPSTLGAVADA